MPAAVPAGPVVPFAPGTWSGARKEIVWHSVLRADEGYGTAGRNLLLALERQGVDVAVAPGGATVGNEVPRGFERFHKGEEEEEGLWGRLGLYYSYKVRPSTMRCERLISYSMWESNLVPCDHVEEINRADALHYVPCKQNVQSHQECGVRVPVKVLHHGVDWARFPLLDRSDRPKPNGVYTFGDLSPRKGVDVLVRAFLDEFGRKEPVRLLLKSVAPSCAYGTDDPRVEVVSGATSTRKPCSSFCGGWTRSCCPAAARASGSAAWRPWQPASPLSPRTGAVLRSTSIPPTATPCPAGSSTPGVRSNNMRYHGPWAEPDYEHLRHLMRHLYENPDEGAKKGRTAAARVRKDFTWDRVVAQVVADLDALAER